MSKIKTPTETMAETSLFGELTLFEEAEGDVLEGFLLAKARNVNIPPSWFERTNDGRRNRHAAVVNVLASGDWSGIEVLRDWNSAYQRECFYYGVRILLELDRKGESEW